MSSIQVTINASILADRKKVWDYYTNPVHIIHWNFASDDWCCPSAANDMRPGGKYSARMEAKDGSFGFDFEGIYDEITEGKSFSFTLADDRKVYVSFEDSGNATLATVKFDTETQNPVELQRAGWQAILDNFKKYADQQAETAQKI
ncbi:MAG: SRPBCC family protein [Ignavibacteriales bacterium]|nr:SRPBCC family protein [Ignavibacteriales bacterium]MCF8316542.1 SRPBCC family protein [Ignavibacteriales bacterium]MCF8437465.1 SRPBCC family protein [Ignavibacteriales bacterium]